MTQDVDPMNIKIGKKKSSKSDKTTDMLKKKNQKIKMKKKRVKNLKIGQVLIRKVMIMTIAEREDGVDLEVVIENVQMIIQDREDDPEVDHHDVDKSTNHVMPL